MRYSLLLSVFAGYLLLSPVSAQRVFKSVDPTELDPELSFDVNSVPVSFAVNEFPGGGGQGATVDINFSPNIVFSPDGTRGFVSYTGSDKVMVFDPASGEVISMLVVGANPGQLTLTPDGKKLGVVSLFLVDNLPKPGESFDVPTKGGISVIDVATLDVRSIELADVFFSIANNIVFSADGQTGFVGSSGTDEIVRFDVETLSENSRLEMTGGSRPSAITLAPNGTFFAIVLVGSTNLSRFEVPDSVALIDTNSFQLIKKIVPDTERDPDNPDDLTLPHDFVISNTVAFTADGKFAVIADQSQSQVSFLPAFSNDRAWILDLEAGTAELSFPVGGIAAGAYRAPSGEIVVVSGVDVSILDLETGEGRRIPTPFFGFRPSARPAFDGSTMFLAAALDDALAVFNMATNELSRIIAVGGGVERDGSVIPSAPLHTSLAPDGRTLAVLNFNANTIDLLEPTEQFFLPRMLSNTTFFTGVALTNTSDKDAEIVLAGLRQNGTEFRDDADTEEVEFNNPRELVIPAGQQLSDTAVNLIEGMNAPELNGWIFLDSTAPLSGFALIGDREVKRLDGAPAVDRTGQKFVVTELHVAKEGMTTELAILNPNFNSATVDMDLMSFAGELIFENQFTLPGRGARAISVATDSALEEGFFDESDFEDVEGAYLIITVDTGVFIFERYFDRDRMAALGGIDIGNPTPLRQVAPQVATRAGAESFLTLVNTGEEDLSVTLTLNGDDGLAVAAPVPVDLAAGTAIRKEVAEIFELGEGDDLVSGWILAEADKAGLAGSTEVRLFEGRAMTTVPLQSAASQAAPAALQSVASKNLLFSHLAEGLGFSTGLSLVNSSIDPATFLLEVFDVDGSPVRSGEFSLPRNGRVSQLLGEFFPGFPQQIGGFIKVTSDQELVGLELFFANNMELVASVDSQRIQ